MKTVLLAALCSFGLAFGALAQTPPPPASAAPSAVGSPATTAASASPAEKDDLERSIENKVRKHIKFSVGRHHGTDLDASSDSHDSDDDFGAWMAIPIVGIIFSMVFGAPVAIVFVIMMVNYFKARSLHRTVRMMVEKGQPVPAALLSGPAAISKPRSDLRRGVVLIAVGIAIVMFFGIDDGWNQGAWAVGLIPGLMGVGYLLVWKLEGPGRKVTTDNPPPVP
jgi:hypothetical protein